MLEATIGHLGNDGHDLSIVRMITSNTQIGFWHSRSVLTAKSVPRKHSPTPLRHRHQPGLMLFATRFWPYHQSRLHFPVFSCSVLVRLCPLQSQLSVLWNETHHGRLLLWLICLKLWRVVQSEILFCLHSIYRVVILVPVGFLSARTSLTIPYWPLLSSRCFCPQWSAIIEILEPALGHWKLLVC